ncbi:prepilin-type N-terminal cleavage/methylation domain-containing protein, partial [Methanosphaera sp.]|uniref:prepilin-type N-terminal cleavage/methylation domain-containing protein n=1 Tax=Methanosphaera sp. TaxID=2666342 RepID=UPI0025F5DDA5
MNKKGFTLIELLAVILILGIIALIAIPSVIKVVDNSKVEAGKNSVHGYLKAVDTAIATNMLNGNALEDGLYSKGEISNIEIDGKMQDANIQIEKGKVVYGAFCSNGKSYTYDGNKVIYQENDTSCRQTETINGKITSIYSDGSRAFMFLTDSGDAYGFGTSYYLFGRYNNGGTYVNKPTKMFSNVKLKKVDIYYKGGVGITTDNDLVSWGEDDYYYSTLNEPQPYPKYAYFPPTKPDIDVKFKDAGIGYYAVYAISVDGDIYFAGQELDGDSYKLNYKLKKIKEGNFEKVFVNGGIAYFIDNVGDVWAMSNLRIDEESMKSYLFGNTILTTPTKVLSGKNIRDIYYYKDQSGGNSTLFLGVTESNEVYSWGFNYFNMSSPTGYVSEAYKLDENSKAPYKNVEKIAPIGTNRNIFLVDGKVYDVYNYSEHYETKEIHFDERIVDVKTIYDKYLFLTESGKLYTMGTLGAASGLGVNEVFLEPHKTNIKADDIKIVGDSTAILTLNGVAKVWGNVYINGEPSNVSNPISVRDNVKSIIPMSDSHAGYYIIDNDNNVSTYFPGKKLYPYTYSTTADGSWKTYTYEPTDPSTWGIKFKKIISTESTPTHFFGISTDNKVYAWGENTYNTISTSSTR